MRTALIWFALGVAVACPMLAATASPQLAWRDGIYIAAGFAGIAGLTILLIQPLLAGRDLPGLSALQSRRAHRILGQSLVAAVLAHVAGLWITSPPDVIDALLLASPTPFSLWGVIAMWAVFVTAVLAAVRRRIRIRPQHWQQAHIGLALVIAAGTIAHALLIEGTMEPITKYGLCTLVGLVTLRLAYTRRIWTSRRS